MIKRELEKDEALKEEDWKRFLPQFKKRNVQRKKIKHPEIVKKTKTLFPPAPMPRKEDIQMASGEYFLSKELKASKKMDDKRRHQKEVSEERRKERQTAYESTERPAKRRMV